MAIDIDQNRVIKSMALKYAQRRDVKDVAHQLGAEEQEVQDALDRLQRQGLVRRWPDDQWGLTSTGNSLRNRLTADSRLK